MIFVAFCAFLNNLLFISFSVGIESVVDEKAGKATGSLVDGMCNACEMAVVWMQTQAKSTLDQILNYVNEVKFPICLLFFS